MEKFTAPKLPTLDAAADPVPATGQSRRGFLKRAATTAALAAPAVMLASSFSGKAMGFNVQNPGGQKAEFVSIRQHENDHVGVFLAVLGSDARPKPTFQGLLQPSINAFVFISQVLENTGVGAYAGALPSVNSQSVVGTLAAVAAIEARHAGYINTYVQDPITKNALGVANPSFEDALSPQEVVAGASKFVASLNGGPALTYTGTPSASNDIAILNFLLALEYLEAEFYNLNVAHFYKV